MNDQVFLNKFMLAFAELIIGTKDDIYDFYDPITSAIKGIEKMMDLNHAYSKIPFINESFIDIRRTSNLRKVNLLYAIHQYLKILIASNYGDYCPDGELRAKKELIVEFSSVGYSVVGSSDPLVVSEPVDETHERTYYLE